MKKIEDLALLATGIGSLPHKDAESAINFLDKEFKDIIVWPQLPIVSHMEGMFLQYSENFPGLIYDKDDDRFYVDTEDEKFYTELESLMIDYEAIVEEGNLELLEKYALSEARCSAFRPWLEKCKGQKPVAVKGQITGPFTFATTLSDQNRKLAFYDETLRETVEKFLTLKALWQIEHYKKEFPEALYIMSIDEPSISQYGSSAFLTVTKDDLISTMNNVADIIHKFGGISFTHCCGKTDWSIITSSRVKILNFDAYNFADSLLLYPEDIKQYIDNDCILAWGLVPTLDTKQVIEANKDNVIEIMDKTINGLVKKGLDKDKIISHSMITPSCGTGSLSVELAEKSLSLIIEVSEELKSRYK
ncbi:MAG: hypothetical protein AB7V50_08035 [Vampirovibrionia bacterium]